MMVIRQMEITAIEVVILGIYLSLSIECRLTGIRSACFYDKELNLFAQDIVEWTILNCWWGSETVELKKSGFWEHL